MVNGRLENGLSKYACVAEGDVIRVKYYGVEYKIEVLECRPEKAVRVIDTDITIELENAKDYDENESSTQKKIVPFTFKGDEIEKKEEVHIDKFPGKGVAIKKRKRLLPFDDNKSQPQIIFDPRKHKINYVKAPSISDNTNPIDNYEYIPIQYKKPKIDHTQET